MALPLVQPDEIKIPFKDHGEVHQSSFVGKVVGIAIKGKGRDEAGAFNIGGSVINKEGNVMAIEFEKRYIGKRKQHTVMYQGQIKVAKLSATGKGTWKFQSSSGSFEIQMGSFKLIEPVTLKAQFHQRNKWSPFPINAVVESSGELTGYGQDRVGKFVIDGNINVNEMTVYFEKRMLNQHVIVYEGKIDPKSLMVKGRWYIGTLCDRFKMPLPKKIFEELKKNQHLSAINGKQQLYSMLGDRRDLMIQKKPEIDAAIKECGSKDNMKRLQTAWSKSEKTENELLTLFNSLDKLQLFMRLMLENERYFNMKFKELYSEQHQAAYRKYGKFLNKFNSTKKILNKVNDKDFIGLYFDAAILLADTWEQRIDFCIEKMQEEGLGVSCSGGKVKRVPRAFYKTYFVYDGDVRSLTDLLRCSFVFDNFDDLYRGVKIVHDIWSKDGGILRLKNRFVGSTKGSVDDEKEADGDWIPFGYRDLICNVYAPESNQKVVCEVQFHLRFFYENKKPSHEVYKRARLFEIDGSNKAYDYANAIFKKEIEDQMQNEEELKLKYLAQDGNVTEWKRKK